MTKVNFRSLAGAIAEDMLSFYGAPVSTLKVLSKAVRPKWLIANSYLKWDDFAYILNSYAGELSKCLAIEISNKKLIIPQILEIDNTDGSISIDRIFLERRNEGFNLSQKIRGLTEVSWGNYQRMLKFKRKRYSNGRLMRLSNYSLTQTQLHLHVQMVRYECVCRTNLMLDANFGRNESTLRSFVHSGGRIGELSQSQLGDPVGINFVLFTADGKIIMPRRSQKVIVRPGQLSPSFSGDFEYTDSPAKKSPVDIVALLREGFEELGILVDNLEESQIRFLGMTRELIRGGKPEMFFEGHTNLTAREVLALHKNAVDSYEFRRTGWVFFAFGNSVSKKSVTENDYLQIRSSFEVLLQEHGKIISVPLLTNLVLWIRRIRNSVSFSI